MKQKSLRQSAREMGVSASYLSQVTNGKRPASERVSKALCTQMLSKSVKQTVKREFGGSVWGSNPPKALLVPPDGFEVREAHRDLSAPWSISYLEIACSRSPPEKTDRRLLRA